MQEAKIEVFRPVEEKVEKKYGKGVIVRKPVLGDLFFAKGIKSEIEKFIQRVGGYVQFKYRSYGYHNLMIVPQHEMENFIAAIKGFEVKKYYMPDEFKQIPKGVRVKVSMPDNPVLDGIEGIFVRPIGRRSRCLIVDIPGILAATVEISPEYLEVR